MRFGGVFFQIPVLDHYLVQDLPWLLVVGMDEIQLACRVICPFIISAFFFGERQSNCGESPFA